MLDLALLHKINQQKIYKKTIFLNNKDASEVKNSTVSLGRERTNLVKEVILNNEFHGHCLS